MKIYENQNQSEKPFSCTQCASKFTNPADMKMHENQNQHKTAAVNATLNPRIYLKIHENQDQNGKPSNCS